MLADAVGSAVPVSVGTSPPDAAAGGVVDLGTRGMDSAAAVATVLDQPVDGRLALHKIDSTLRGHWAAEVGARCRVSGRRLVVLAGWPEMGRTCRSAVVRDGAEPVGVVTDHVDGGVIVEDPADLDRRWREGHQVLVCDVTDTAQMAAMAQAVAALPLAEVLVAGPAGPLAAVLVAVPGSLAVPDAPALSPPEHIEPVVVVCGSANRRSHEQLARLRAALAGHGPSRAAIEVFEVPEVRGVLHRGPAAEVAAAAGQRIAAVGAGTVVAIGGDTVAALLGAGTRWVGGTFDRMMPWSRDATGSGPLVITKAGGFGDPEVLVRLLARRDWSA